MLRPCGKRLSPPMCWSELCCFRGMWKRVLGCMEPERGRGGDAQRMQSGGQPHAGFSSGGPRSWLFYAQSGDMLAYASHVKNA